MKGRSFYRIIFLQWADILVTYAFFLMQDYLTNVWGLSFTHAAAIMNIFGGISLILPLLFLLLVDAFLGNFWMLVLSSIISYSFGLGMVWLSTPPILASSTGTCKRYEEDCIGQMQRILFYIGMPFIAVGVAAFKVSICPFLDEQDANPRKGFQGKKGFQIAAITFIALIPLFGTFGLPYIKPWSIRFGIPAIATVFATIIFLSSWSSYIRKDAQRSPITNVFRVYAAFATKICQPLPRNSQLDLCEAQKPRLFTCTQFLRCLDKATIDVTLEGQKKNRWKVCTAAEVEEAKIVIRMIPMWLTFIVCGIISSIGNTYFVEQSSNMNHKLGRWKVPPEIFLFSYDIIKPTLNTLALRAFSSGTKERDSINHAKNVASAGKRSAVGIGMAMIFSILCCITSAIVEKRRLDVIRSHELLDKPDANIPMSVFWLLFQFCLLAGLDSFFVSSVFEFYNWQSPDSMDDYTHHFRSGVFGLGNMFGVLSVYIVGRVSETGGRTNWFQFTLNKSRLDKYYWVLAALGTVNLGAFVMVASLYNYNRELTNTRGVDDNNEGAENNDEGGTDNDEGDIEGAKEPVNGEDIEDMANYS